MKKHLLGIEVHKFNGEFYVKWNDVKGAFDTVTQPGEGTVKVIKLENEKQEVIGERTISQEEYAELLTQPGTIKIIKL